MVATERTRRVRAVLEAHPVEHVTAKDRYREAPVRTPTSRLGKVCRCLSIQWRRDVCLVRGLKANRAVQLLLAVFKEKLRRLVSFVRGHFVEEGDGAQKEDFADLRLEIVELFVVKLANEGDCSLPRAQLQRDDVEVRFWSLENP